MKKENPAIIWHPAFLEAIKLELGDYMDSLQFYPEFQLADDPLRIDCIVIKKAPNITIKKNIATIFREVNLLEYKNPEDYVSVNDFYKVYGYACLYSSFEKVPITNLTISFVESRYPKKLVAHLTKVRKYTVEENSPGIYIIKGDLLPIQIINSRRLSADENLWLKDLQYGLDPREMQRILTEISRQGKEVKIGAYLEAITRANNDSSREVIKMSRTRLSFEELLVEEGFHTKWETKGEVRGKESEALAIAKKMISSGFSFETVVNMTELDPEKVKALY